MRSPGSATRSSPNKRDCLITRAVDGGSTGTARQRCAAAHGYPKGVAMLLSTGLIARGRLGQPGVLAAIGTAAEDAGRHRIWFGDHVVYPTKTQPRPPNWRHWRWNSPPGTSPIRHPSAQRWTGARRLCTPPQCSAGLDKTWKPSGGSTHWVPHRCSTRPPSWACEWSSRLHRVVGDFRRDTHAG
jgi:hypothetical protein